jgi:hypothetical protein
LRIDIVRPSRETQRENRVFRAIPNCGESATLSRRAMAGAGKKSQLGVQKRPPERLTIEGLREAPFWTKD